MLQEFQIRRLDVGLALVREPHVLGLELLAVLRERGLHQVLAAAVLRVVDAGGELGDAELRQGLQLAGLDLAVAVDLPHLDALQLGAGQLAVLVGVVLGHLVVAVAELAALVAEEGLAVDLAVAVRGRGDGAVLVIDQHAVALAVHPLDVLLLAVAVDVERDGLAGLAVRAILGGADAGGAQLAVVVQVQHDRRAGLLRLLVGIRRAGGVAGGQLGLGLGHQPLRVRARRRRGVLPLAVPVAELLLELAEGVRLGGRAARRSRRAGRGATRRRRGRRRRTSASRSTRARRTGASARATRRRRAAAAEQLLDHLDDRGQRLHQLANLARQVARAARGTGATGTRGRVRVGLARGNLRSGAPRTRGRVRVGLANGNLRSASGRSLLE